MLTVVASSADEYSWISFHLLRTGTRTHPRWETVKKGGERRRKRTTSSSSLSLIVWTIAREEHPSQSVSQSAQPEVRFQKRLGWSLPTYCCRVSSWKFQKKVSRYSSARETNALIHFWLGSNAIFRSLFSATKNVFKNSPVCLLTRHLAEGEWTKDSR